MGPEVALLQQRADEMRSLIAANLWDDKSGNYANRFPNGTFNRRLSPTSFYAMHAKAPSSAQVERMANEWLFNPNKFCVTPQGNFEGNSDDCYWGLPSITRDDPAYPAQGYWRGYVWGPMAMLTYWGLKEYDEIPVARAARQGLSKQMNALMLSQWR